MKTRRHNKVRSKHSRRSKSSRRIKVSKKDKKTRRSRRTSMSKKVKRYKNKRTTIHGGVDTNSEKINNLKANFCEIIKRLPAAQLELDRATKIANSALHAANQTAWHSKKGREDKGYKELIRQLKILKKNEEDKKNILENLEKGHKILTDKLKNLDIDLPTIYEGCSMFFEGKKVNLKNSLIEHFGGTKKRRKKRSYRKRHKN